jgi:membrane fusion protein (multidrug efflux system)
MKRSSVIAGVLVAAVLIGAVGGLALYRNGSGEGGPPGGAGGGGAGGAFEPSEAVEIIEARRATWLQTADLVGTVVATRSVMVSNELAGVVTSVGFDSGSVLEAGQVVLTQDDTTDKADLDAARASVRVAEANQQHAESRIRLADRELERLTSAAAGSAATQRELDRARSELEVAQADKARWAAEIDQARALVAQVETRLAKRTIRAPFRARAGMRTVHEGQYLIEGAEVVALQELSETIYLDFAIPQEYAPRVTPGTAVMATGELLGPDPVRIEVVAADATVNYSTRNLRVRGVVANPRGTLVPGMSVQIRVPVDEPRDVVVVPGPAVRRAAYGSSVFVVAPDEKGELRARQRFVTLGRSLGEDVIVEKGLEAGERVAGAGSFKLRDGAKVMEGPPPAAPGGKAGPGGGEAQSSAQQGDK